MTRRAPIRVVWLPWGGCVEVPGSSVNRCIAVAAHGKRCQQTTFRGSPYCWHHTQSRKLPAPSRMQANPRRSTPKVVASATPLAPLEIVARCLSAEQLDAFARFLDAGGSGAFSFEKDAGEVVAAHPQGRTSRPLGHRFALPYPGKRETKNIA
jgi:hypothetical protein